MSTFAFDMSGRFKYGMALLMIAMPFTYYVALRVLPNPHPDAEPYRTMVTLLALGVTVPFYLTWLYLCDKKTKVGLFVAFSGSSVRIIMLALITIFFYLYQPALFAWAVLLYAVYIGIFLFFEVAGIIAIGYSAHKRSGKK